VKNRPIGVFDSGLGGLTVVKQIKKILPHEDIVYLGDTARVPYGTRSKETIIKFSFEDVNFLVSRNVKCIVIACNTASALTGKELKSKLDIPVFDVISPTLKYARSVAKNNKMGVIGTRGTIESGAYKVPFAIPCPLFVPFIEEGDIGSEAFKIIVKECLSYFEDKHIDTLIMGCTHYPIIQNIIQKEIGKNVKLIDPGRAVAGELKYFLTKNDVLNEQKRSVRINYFVTDLTERFTKVAEMFLGEKIKGRINEVSID
jgi:glutamate racemase